MIFSFFQETSVASLKASLETMQGSAASLNEELGSDLLSQLSVEDQREVDYLNDQIKNLTQQNKEALTERIRVKFWDSEIELWKCLLYCEIVIICGAQFW